jgi:hypothetical protein
LAQQAKPRARWKWRAVETVAKSGGASAELVAKGSDAQRGAEAFSQAWEIYRDGAEEGRRAALGSPPSSSR